MSRKLYYFSPQMIEELKTKYPTTKASDLAELFNCSTRKIYNLAYELGLKKDKEWSRENSRKNMLRPDHPAKKFWKQKGCVPLNKGKKQAEYMTPEAIERTKATQLRIRKF